MNMADEGVVEEMAMFQKAVRDMYHHNGMGVVFIETVMPSSLHKREQTQVECIPVPQECEMDCPMYFKQSLMEANNPNPNPNPNPKPSLILIPNPNPNT